MKMRYIPVLFGLALAAGTAVAAGYGPGSDKGDRRGARTERMVERLGLDDDQRDQVVSLMQASRAEAQPLTQAMREGRARIDALVRDGSFDEAAVREAASAQAAALEELIVIRARARAQVNALLTPQQREQLAQRSSKRHRRDGKRGQRGERRWEREAQPETAPEPKS